MADLQLGCHHRSWSGHDREILSPLLQGACRGVNRECRFRAANVEIDLWLSAVSLLEGRSPHTFSTIIFTLALTFLNGHLGAQRLCVLLAAPKLHQLKSAKPLSATPDTTALKPGSLSLNSSQDAFWGQTLDSEILKTKLQRRFSITQHKASVPSPAPTTPMTFVSKSQTLKLKTPKKP